MEHSSELALNVAGIITLLLIAAATLALTKRIKLPFTVVLVVIGMALSWLSGHFPQLLGPLQGLTLSPDIILYVFLPTLIFESAFNLDARQLRKNIWPILTLAVPGLLLSTAIIGFIVHYTTSLPLPVCLLLGAILSATDPVAVIALFKKLGAPQRLTILVEGESLFNDATSIVLSRLLVTIVVASTGFSTNTLLDGTIEFINVFIGGLVVGIALGLLIGYVLGKVRADTYIETTLTTILAYASFLIAEEFFHVSGVVATVAAGLTLGSWGRMKISADVRHHVDHFWEYMAFVATALIFLMVGMRVELDELLNTADILAWVLLAMLVSRVFVVYGLIPMVNRLPHSISADWRYQSVMYWGGLRGAIALAIVLSLPEFPHSDTLVAIVMGAVLFTLLVQGLTIEALVKKLGLDRPPLSDRIAEAEGLLQARQNALQRLPELQKGGLFSAAIATRLQHDYESELEDARQTLIRLREHELDFDEETKLLYLRCLSEEKAMYIELFNKGHISEDTYRSLLLILTLQMDTIRIHGHYESIQQHLLPQQHLHNLLYRFIRHLPGLSGYAEQLRLQHISRAYEQAWGHYQSAQHVLDNLDNIDPAEHGESVVMEVRSRYKHWYAMAQAFMDQMAGLYPEFVNTMQVRLGRRLTLLAEINTISTQAETGALPCAIAEELQHELQRQLWALRGQDIRRLKVEPEELLRKVPFFADIPEDDFTALAGHMRSLSIPAQELIIRQGQRGDRLFLIARGVVRVSRTENNQSKDLASLMAGDFFGEMALLHAEPRTASVQAITPCTLYSLKRTDVELAMQAWPSIRIALEKADRARRQAMNEPTD